MAKSRTASDDDVVTIKKYANRRLYDTERSCYITLDDLGAMVREGRDFRVVDAKSGDDITHNVLTQIIMDTETRGETLLPVNFLRHRPANPRIRTRSRVLRFSRGRMTTPARRRVSSDHVEREATGTDQPCAVSCSR